MVEFPISRARLHTLRRLAFVENSGILALLIGDSPGKNTEMTLIDRRWAATALTTMDPRVRPPSHLVAADRNDEGLT